MCLQLKIQHLSASGNNEHDLQDDRSVFGGAARTSALYLQRRLLTVVRRRIPSPKVFSFVHKRCTRQLCSLIPAPLLQRFVLTRSSRFEVFRFIFTQRNHDAVMTSLQTGEDRTRELLTELAMRRKHRVRDNECAFLFFSRDECLWSAIIDI